MKRTRGAVLFVCFNMSSLTTIGTLPSCASLLLSRRRRRRCRRCSGSHSGGAVLFLILTMLPALLVTIETNEFLFDSAQY